MSSLGEEDLRSRGGQGKAERDQTRCSPPTMPVAERGSGCVEPCLSSMEELGVGVPLGCQAPGEGM